MGYFKDSLKGVSWMTAFRVLYRLIGIVRIAIIAHLLTPLALGVFGVASIVLGFLEIITETGVNIFLIQENKDNIDNYIDSAWIISIIRGAVISFLILIFAWPISAFFKSPSSLNLLYIAALVPFLRGFINPSIVKFQKNLQFNREFGYRISVFFVDSFVSILGVILLKSVYGMLLGMIIGVLFEVAYTFMAVRPWPKLRFDKIKFEAILNRGKWVTLFGIFDYLYTQSDNVIVGKILGLTSLGIYQNAYKISTAPLSEIGDIFYRVTFPIFSRISGDKDRLKSAFLKNTLTTFILMTLSGVFIFIFASPIVNILFGKGWEAAIPVVRLLSILGVVRGVASSTNSMLVAKEQQKYSAIITIASTIGLWATIVPLTKIYGIIGAGMAATFGTLISLPLTIYYVRKSLSK